MIIYVPRKLCCPQCLNDDEAALPTLDELAKAFDGALFVKCTACNYQGPIGAPAPEIRREFEAVLAWNYNSIRAIENHPREFWVKRGALKPLSSD